MVRFSHVAVQVDIADSGEHVGPIARIGPNYVLCGDPFEIRRLWGVRSGFDRGIWYKGFQLDPPHDCTVSMRDNDIHTVLRAKLANGVRSFYPFQAICS
jgi:hypothetical protein